MAATREEPRRPTVARRPAWSREFGGDARGGWQLCGGPAGSRTHRDGTREAAGDVGDQRRRESSRVMDRDENGSDTDEYH
jgi:hypothetical protein